MLMDEKSRETACTDRTRRMTDFKAAFERRGCNAASVLDDSPEGACLRGLVGRLGFRRRDVTLINLVFDRSASMSQDVLDLLVPSGLEKILRQVRDNSYALLLQAVVRVTVFSSGVTELLPWMPVEEALERVGSLKVRSGGITRLDSALNDAIVSVGRMKEAMDRAREGGVLAGSRKGSVIMVFTDGYITDDLGDPVPFPEELAARVKDLQGRRAATFMAVGVDGADASQLAAMAPPSMRAGKRVSHALQYTGDPDSLDWDAVCHFIAQGSSGPGAGAYEREGVVNHSGFELVFG